MLSMLISLMKLLLYFHRYSLMLWLMESQSSHYAPPRNQKLEKCAVQVDLIQLNVVMNILSPKLKLLEHVNVTRMVLILPSHVTLELNQHVKLYKRKFATDRPIDQ